MEYLNSKITSDFHRRIDAVIGGLYHMPTLVWLMAVYRTTQEKLVIRRSLKNHFANRVQLQGNICPPQTKFYGDAVCYGHFHMPTSIKHKTA